MKIKSLLLGFGLAACANIAVANDFMPGVLMVDSTGSVVIQETYMGNTRHKQFDRVISGNFRARVTDRTYVQQMQNYILGKQRAGQKYVCTRAAGAGVREFRTTQNPDSPNTPLTVSKPHDCLKINLSKRGGYFVPVAISATNEDGIRFKSYDPFGVLAQRQGSIINYTLTGVSGTNNIVLPVENSRNARWNTYMDLYRAAGGDNRNLKKRAFMCISNKTLTGNPNRNRTILSAGTAASNMRGTFAQTPYITNKSEKCFRY